MRAGTGSTRGGLLATPVPPQPRPKATQAPSSLGPPANSPKVGGSPKRHLPYSPRHARLIRAQRPSARRAELVCRNVSAASWASWA